MNEELKKFKKDNGLTHERIKELCGIESVETVSNWFRTKPNKAPGLVLKHLKVLKRIEEL